MKRKSKEPGISLEAEEFLIEDLRDIAAEMQALEQAYMENNDPPPPHPDGSLPSASFCLGQANRDYRKLMVRGLALRTLLDKVEGRHNGTVTPKQFSMILAGVAGGRVQ